MEGIAVLLRTEVDHTWILYNEVFKLLGEFCPFKCVTC